MASEEHENQEEGPLTTIVTLAMDVVSEEWFEQQRQQFYPAALNRIPAHLSLFHALPGSAHTRHVLRETASAAEGEFSMEVEGVKSMGRGVMYVLDSPDLLRLHRSLADSFKSYLTPQDKQPLRPHVVVQNKVEPGEAKALLALLQASFTKRQVQGRGFDWWEYQGGPWRLIERFPFGVPQRDQVAAR